MKRFITILSVLAFACCLLFSVSAESIINNDGLSYNMAFAGSDGTGLGYLSSGFIEYRVNDDFILVSPTSTGTISSSSFLSSVIYLKKTDDTYILHKDDSFTYSFSNFGFDIKHNGITYNASSMEAKIVFTYADNTTLEVVPDIEFNSVLKTFTLYGEAKVTKNVQNIKLDCKFYPSSVGLTGYLSYMYYMMYPPDVSIGLLSRESEILGDIENNIDDAVNGSVDSQNPADSEKVDELDRTEDELLGDVNNYLNDGIGFFDNAVGAIFNFSNGFRAIKVLMAPVFNLPLFGDIILVSVSLGLIGTILGVVSLATSSISKSNKAKSAKKGNNSSKSNSKRKG